MKQHGRSFTSSLASVFRQILHYFTIFDQCFNKRHFLMEISVNRIIIAGFERPQKGWGGGEVVSEWIAFFIALLYFNPRIMTQLCMFSDLKCLKSLRNTYSDFWPENVVASQQCWSEDWLTPYHVPAPPPSPPPRHLVTCLQFLGIDRTRVPCLILLLG